MCLFIYLLILYLFQGQQNIRRLIFHFLCNSLDVCPQYSRQSSPIVFNFILSSVHLGRIQDIKFERHGLPLPVHCMGKPFKVSINYFDLFVYI